MVVVVDRRNDFQKTRTHPGCGGEALAPGCRGCSEGQNAGAWAGGNPYRNASAGLLPRALPKPRDGRPRIQYDSWPARSPPTLPAENHSVGLVQPPGIPKSSRKLIDDATIELSDGR